MDNGYIKLHRKMLDWEWYADANTMRLFIHCLLKANWKDGRFKGMDIKRGQFATSLNILSDELRLSVRQIRVSLEHLKVTGEVTDHRQGNYRIITVLNYSKYQESDIPDDSPVTDLRQTYDNAMTNQRQTCDKPEVVSSNNIEESKESKEGKKVRRKESKEDVVAIATHTPKASKADNNLRIFDQMVQAYGFTDLIINSMSEWMRYKGDEKKYEYKETGMKALLTQTKKHVDTFGDRAVANLISQCMASGWQGIIWDRLNSGNQSRGGNNGSYTFMDMWREEYG